MGNDPIGAMAPTNNLPAFSGNEQRSLATQISQTLNRLRELPSILVGEGQVEIANRATNLLYANAFASLMIAHVDLNGNKVGGYGALTNHTDSNQPAIDTIMSTINARINGRPGNLLIAGSEDVWNQKLPYNSTLFRNIGAIIAYFQRNNLSTTMHLLNTSHYIPASSEDATVALKVGAMQYSIVMYDAQILLKNNW